MDPTLLLAAGVGAIFLGLLVALATVGSLTSERHQVSRSLAAIEAMQTPALARQLERPFDERVARPALERAARIGRRLTAAGQTERIARKLELAGSPAGWDVDRVLAFKVLGLIAGLALGILLPLAFGAGFAVTLGLAVLLTLAGFFAPDMALYQMAYNRKERIRRELPDAMDLLTISVEAGLSFDAALAQVARNTDGPLAEEFFRVLQEMQIGLGRSEAIRALGERNDVPELRAFTTAMVQADAFGIPMANVLRVQAKEMRVKRSQRAEEMAQKVPVKILFPLIFCILPSLFVVVIGPAAIGIIQAFTGRL